MTNLSDSESGQFLSQVERVRIEIKDKFSKSHQLLHEGEAALLSELDQLVASYRGEGVRKQIQLISSSKESIISALKENENYEALQLSIAPLNARIRELEVSLERTEARMRRVELEWDGELEGRLRETGRIRIIGQFDYKKKDTSLQEQPVTLIWKKQLTTIETKITYFDSLNGVIQLNSDKLNNSFTSSAYLTPGNHNGILTLSNSDYNGETEPFHVLEKSDVVQEFTLLLTSRILVME